MECQYSSRLVLWQGSVMLMINNDKKDGNDNKSTVLPFESMYSGIENYWIKNRRTIGDGRNSYI